MIDVDLLMTGVLLAAAVVFLGWRFTSGRAAPACHQLRGDEAANQVVVGDALARGVRAARARRRRRRRQK